MVRIEHNSDVLGNAFKVAFWRFLMFFCCTCSFKAVETLFVWHETWPTTVFATYYFVEMHKIENNGHMLDITFEVAFLRFIKLFWQLLAYSHSNMVCLA